MFDYIKEPDGSIRVDGYRYGTAEDVTFGHLRRECEDEFYWHFYPAADCVLNAGGCRRLMERLADLNRDLVQNKP
jgi:hypothetical protein